jgi:hypothetical protein
VQQDNWDYLVVSGNHACKTEDQMTKRGLKVQLLHLPNYRASPVHAGKLKESLDKLKIGENTVLVLQLFDNGIFMVSTEEGGYIPMHKAVDGKLHAIGDREVVPKDLQWRLFEQVEKDIERYKKNPLIILVPLPSYMESPCCDKEEHMANRSRETFKQKLEEDTITCAST